MFEINGATAYVHPLPSPRGLTDTDPVTERRHPWDVVLILLAVLFLFVIVLLAKTVRIVPQARAGIVERFGKYKQTLPAGLNIVMPFIDKVRYLIDLREQVVSFPPQPVITEDNLVVSIDTVIYFQVTDPVAATYEIANYIQAVEQLTMTTLRNIVGGMDLEQTLTSREEINTGLRGVLDEATGKWGIRVNRVEIKGIDPPPSIKDAMEKQMRADRDKRALILTAEGQRQSAILTAEGNKQSAILNAEGDRESQILRAQADRESQILRAQGEGQAIQTVFQAIHDGQPDQSLLAYQYLQMMPKIAEGDANKVWVVPSEITKALEGLGSSIHEIAGHPAAVGRAAQAGGHGPHRAASCRGSGAADRELSQANEAVEAAIAEAESAANPGAAPQRPPGDRRRRPTCRRARPGGAARSVTLLEARRDPARRDRGRHHQHRGGVGNADHVPDPARVRRAAGDGQRVEHGRPGARLAVRRRSATAGSSPGSGAGCSGSASASLIGGTAGAVLLLVLPSEAFDAIVPVADRARAACSSSSGRGSRAPGRARAEARGGLPDHGAWWVWPAVAGAGRVRRLLRRRAGRAADGDPRHRRRRPRCSGTTRPRTSSPCSSTPSRRWSSSLVADVNWPVAGADRRRVGDRRPDRRHRRPPPARPVLRGVIVVVGVAALVVFLSSTERLSRPSGRRSRRRTGRASPAGGPCRC